MSAKIEERPAPASRPGSSPEAGYFSEMRRNWQPLLAACLGLVAGTISNYINNLFAPELIAEFGWSRAQFALIGLTVIVSAVSLPVSGRLADIYGMRRIATIGVVGLPIIFIGFALQPGSFAIYFVLSLLQLLAVGSLVGIVIYSRLIVSAFDRSRGLALGVASCAPPLAAVVLSPLLNLLVTQNWRLGYIFMALFTGLLGLAALRLIPDGFDDRNRETAMQGAVRRDMRELLRSKPFFIIFGAMLACNLHFTMQTTQLNLIVIDAGFGTQEASLMLSTFAVGVIAGRLLCGVALDRFHPHYVSTACFLVPSAGLAMLAHGPAGIPGLALAILSLGFSVGAEGDLAAYLVTRYFRPGLFGTVFGLFAAAMSLSAMLGAVLLSETVAQTGGYGFFMAIAASTMFVGALSFLLLGKPDRALDETLGNQAP